LNQASKDRGLFNGCFFRYEKSELEKGEQFGNPDYARTVDLKKDANYGFIEGDFVKEGTVVKRGDVLIVKSTKIPQPTDQYLYTDKSTVYKYPEPSTVEKVIVTRDDESTPLCKVKLRSPRKIRVGDKISSRNGNKSIIAAIWPASEMPYDENGLIPDIIINPHGIPSRMVIGQIMETCMGELAVRKGIFLEASAFRKIDMKAIIKELETKYGVGFGGHRRMYNGRTGNWFDTLVFVGPTGYQRLQKFVIDESYAVSTGPTSALTRQPLDGKINEGGLRIGEMEKDVYTANSCMRALHEKFYAHSDGIDIPICRVCGRRAIVNEKHGIYRCKFCGDNADIAMVSASWVSNIFYSEISAMNIEPRFELEPYAYSRPEAK
jgi:DNA-directed RNA polymerase beta subunit